MFKPFKPPSFVRPGATTSIDDSQHVAKRQRLDDGNPPRIPLREAINAAINTDVAIQKESTANTNDPSGTYYTVLWRKFTTKKNKTWDGDGVLKVKGGFAVLEDVSGREMGRVAWDRPLLPESRLSIAGKDVEVDDILSRKDYLSRRVTKGVQGIIPPVSPIVVPKPRPRPEVIATSTFDYRSKKPVHVSALNSDATRTKFKNPMIEQDNVLERNGDKPTPRHDPNIANALVMPRPKHCPKGKQIVDVVVDPILSKHLRQHQRDGVKFLYECVMDIREFGGQGAILADEMGLGKTLQTITLLWTLLKQNPIHDDPSVVKKALIVCPATLMNNWKKEFRKWLGMERIGVFVFDDNKKRITDFTKGRTYSVLIISYEKLRTNIDELQKGPGIDIVIADEGHRLKKEQNKSGVAIRSLTTTKRIILSGTPIQNDLTEFFSMVTFVNPGILGSAKAFAKQFEGPIVRSRQPEASPDEIEKGQARSEELAETTSAFILRRTAEILSKYLPTKTEYILLCRPTKTQALLYNKILASAAFQAALSGGAQLHLQLITLLKKVCNAPRLLTPGDHQNKEIDGYELNLVESILSDIPHQLLRNNGASAKLRVLDNLLSILNDSTDEKIVIVSNSTAMLDILGNLLTSTGLTFLRLDGSTPPKVRQDLVDAFNRTSSSERFAFLLSAKAGGQGLNLIGASRLILFDVDWNPAIDAQAMARIHRDGQKRPCIIYRLLIAGGLDEKIWQRQITKSGLADSIMDKKGGGTSSFTREELKDLFRLDTRDRGCQTHELIGCRCSGRGLPPTPISDEMYDLNHNNDQVEILDSDDEVLDLESPTRISTDDDDNNDHRDRNDIVAIDYNDDDDDDVPSIQQIFQKASNVDMDAQERKIEEDLTSARRKARSKRKGKDQTNEESSDMQSLMGYSHIDTSLLSRNNRGTSNEDHEDDNDEIHEGDDAEDMEALIHDDVLLQMLQNDDGEGHSDGERNRIAFIFARSTGGGGGA